MNTAGRRSITAARPSIGSTVLVSNAGWSKPGFFADQTDRDLWQHTVEVNLYNAYSCTQAALGLVISDDGAPVGPHSVWAAGKDAIFTPEQTGYVLRTQPLRRLTTAADVAHPVLRISSPVAARQVTGQVMAVGGGSTMP